MLADIVELKLLAARCLEVDELLDILSIDMHELVDILENYIEECSEEIAAACR